MFINNMNLPSDSKNMENISDIKQETLIEDDLEEQHPDLNEYVDIKEVVAEKPGICFKHEVQEKILASSEHSYEDIKPLLKVEEECEDEEFIQPELILAEDLNSILDGESVVKSEIDDTEACNDPNEKCFKEDLGTPSDSQFPSIMTIFRCEICGKDFDTVHRKSLHMSFHFSKGPVPCTECGETFGKRVFYLQHYRSHFQFCCPGCDKKFISRESLEIHRKTHQNENPKPPKSTPNGTTTQKLYECRYCPEDFTNKSELLAHESFHNGRPVFQCQTCWKNFGRYVELEKHERIHTGSRPFSCPLCSKTFVQQAALTVHQNSAHTEEKKFQCELCQQRFSYNSSLRRHMRLHGGGKPYKCDQCDKSFQSRHALETHANIHDGKLPFACSECPKSFRLSYALKRHYRNHSSGHQEALPFQCGGCWKSFAREETLQQHQTQHETIKCDKCDKQFAKKRDLLSHRLTHAEKTFTCDVCDKKFRCIRSLKRHMIRHAEKVKNEVA